MNNKLQIHFALPFIIFFLIAIYFSGIIFTSCNKGPSEEETTTPSPTSNGYTTPTPTSTGDGTPSPTEVDATATPSSSYDGHWLGDVYLDEAIGPCKPIEFWISGNDLSGYIYWTIGTGNADLNKDCDEDVNGVAITWERQDFSAVIANNSFTWENGSFVPPETIIGWFKSYDEIGGRWLHHGDDNNFNFGPWSAQKLSE